MADAPQKRKYYMPLESNPVVFNRLIHKLGVPSLSFYDVFSIDDPELLAFVPRPALALVFVFPTSKAYEEYVKREESERAAYDGCGEGEDVIWFKQTIGNACGLYAILHAVCNGEARQYTEHDSPLSRLLKKCTPLQPTERALALEDSTEIEASHSAAAHEGDSAVPHSAEAEVEYHYICLVKSHKNERLYLMNGGLKGPVDLGPISGDLLSQDALDVVKEFIQREKGENIGFSLMALSVDDN